MPTVTTADTDNTGIPLRTVELGLGEDTAAQAKAVFSVADIEG